MKRICLFCLLLSLLLSACGSSAESGAQAAPSPQEKLISISQICLTTQLQLGGRNCSLGTPLSAYRLTETGPEPFDYQLFPVFAEDTIVALATGTATDTGEYTVGCGISFAPGLQACYAESPDAAIAIVQAADGPYCIGKTGEPTALHTHPSPGCASIDTLASHRAAIPLSPIRKDVSFVPEPLPGT